MQYATRARLINAFGGLAYDFRRCAGAPKLLRGYSRDTVLEIDDGPQPSVSLLFSVEPESKAGASGATAVATLASTLELGFVEWLQNEIHSRGLGSPWAALHTFDRVDVTAEHIASNVMILTVRSRHPITRGMGKLSSLP
jgi:hypothetical protein